MQTSVTLTRNHPHAPSPVFGTLECTLPQRPIHHGPFNIVIACDRSGSMTAMATDGRTAWDHVTQTVGRIVRYLHQCCRDYADFAVSLRIITFNHAPTILPVPATITADTDPATYDRALAGVPAEGLTNFARPFALLNELAVTDPATKNIHIFLTDGHSNDGIQSATGLLDSLTDGDRWEHYFVGFTPEHDFRLLRRLQSAFRNAHYQFIDSIERSGLVYGEILTTFLYRIATNALLTLAAVHGLEIYDADKNTWGNTLTIPYFVSEDHRTWQIRGTQMPDADAIIGVLLLTDDTTPAPITGIREVPATDPGITKQGWRQRVQECVYAVTHAGTGDDPWDRADNLFAELKTWCDTNSLATDEFQRQLLDDLYIAKERQLSPVYATIRQISQNAQLAYNVTNVPMPSANRAWSPSYAPNPHNPHFANVMAAPSFEDGDDERSPTPEPPSQQMSQVPYSAQTTPVRQHTMESIQRPQN